VLYLILASLDSFFWTLVLVILAMYIVSIVFLADLTTDVEHKEEREREIMRQHWGNFHTALFTCFKSVTGGDDWANFISVYETHNDMVKIAVFYSFIAFCALVMLNLVTGVFVEGAQRIMREDKEAEMTLVAKEIFSVCDHDLSADLSEEEFNNLLDSGVFDDHLVALGINTEDYDMLFKIFDSDSSGSLTLAEFVEGCLKMVSSAKHADVAYARFHLAGLFENLKSQVYTLDAKVDKACSAINKCLQILDEE